jgi:SWI/SNF-related matrix-associated actin-dependent regulator of chromatin subfamily A member 5
MKPYQLAGLSFLLYLNRNGLAGILGDEMGLGKTLQTLSLFQYLKEHDPPAKLSSEIRPFLVVCPLSVLNSWESEAERWTPGLKVLRFHGPMQERERLKRVGEGLEDKYGNEIKQPYKKARKQRTSEGKPLITLDSDSEAEISEPAGFDVVVTTYETFNAEQSWFRRVFVWRYVVLDEGHKIKNELSQVSMALQGLKAEFRLILTGYVSRYPISPHAVLVLLALHLEC